MKQVSFAFIMILFILTPKAKAALPADSLLISRLPGLSSFEQQVSDNSILFQKGVSYVMQDSLEQGVKLLDKAFKAVQEERKIQYISGYHHLELVSFFDLLNKAQLTPAEKYLGLKFVKAIVSKTPGDYDKSLKTFLKQHPESIFGNRLKVYLHSFSKSKELEKSLNKLLKLDSLLIGANVLKAELYFYNGQYVPGINYITKVIRLSPAYAYAYNFRGYCYYQTDQIEKSITDYNKSIVLFPKYINALKNLGDAYYDIKQYHNALLNYKKQMELNPPSAYYGIALCYNKLDQSDSALVYINKLIESRPDFAWGYNVTGDINYDREKYDIAIHDFTKAISLNPEEPNFYEDRGDALYYYEKYDEALKDFEKALLLKNKSDYILKRIGDCYYELSDFDKAVYYSLAAIKIDPEYKNAYVRLGLSYSGLKDYKAAINAYKRAISLDSTYATALGNLGWTYYCTGEFKKSIEYSEQAITYDKKATYAMFNIALATLRLGDFENSKKLYKKFIQVCQGSGLKIENGAIEDLKELITLGIQAKEAQSILNEFFLDYPDLSVIKE